MLSAGLCRESGTISEENHLHHYAGSGTTKAATKRGKTDAGVKTFIIYADKVG